MINQLKKMPMKTESEKRRCGTTRIDHIATREKFDQEISQAEHDTK